MSRTQAKQPVRVCAGCSHPLVKAKKIYDGAPYCARCYGRLFVKAPCSRCQEMVRVMAADTAPICKSCACHDRSCLRCGKPVPRAGIKVGNQVACASCAPHFRKAEPCERCQQPSSKLSRIVGVTEQRICPTCRSKELNATCSSCGKHRPRYAITSSGKSVCKTCAEAPDTVHACPDCGASVGGPGDAPCLSCGFVRSLRRREAGLSKLLKHASSVSLLAAFSNWCTRTNHSSKALAGFDGYAAAIAHLDAALSDDAIVDQALVAAQFSQEELRRTGLFAQFMADVGLHPPPQLLKDQTENKKLAVLLTGIRGEIFEKQIRSYVTDLESREQPLSRRSIRSYVEAAIRLWASANARNAKTLTQDELEAFLRRQPGYRNSVSSFLGFLSASKATPVRLKVPDETPAIPSIKAARLTIENLKERLKRIESASARTAITAELLAVLFGVHLDSILKLKRVDVRQSPRFVEVNLGGWITLNSEIGHWVQKVLEQRGLEAADTDWLFPGRVSASPLSIATVNYHLRYMEAVTTPV